MKDVKFLITEYEDSSRTTRVQIVGWNHYDEKKLSKMPFAVMLHFKRVDREYVIKLPKFLNFFYRRNIQSAKKKLMRNYLKYTSDSVGYVTREEGYKEPCANE